MPIDLRLAPPIQSNSTTPLHKAQNTSIFPEIAATPPAANACTNASVWTAFVCARILRCRILFDSRRSELLARRALCRPRLSLQMAGDIIQACGAIESAITGKEVWVVIKSGIEA